MWMHYYIMCWILGLIFAGFNIHHALAHTVKYKLWRELVLDQCYFVFILVIMTWPLYFGD